MKIAITGHRPNKLNNDYDLTSPLIQWIKGKILEVVDHHIMDTLDKAGESITLITGMALGIDTLFAKIAIANNIPFIAAIPCWAQESKWPELSRKQYQKLINNPLCTKFYVSDQAYTNQCMQDRNIWMVNNCDLLIALWDGTPGGTANCVKYAESKGKEIIRINPKEIII